MSESFDRLWDYVMSGGLYSALANFGILLAVGLKKTSWYQIHSETKQNALGSSVLSLPLLVEDLVVFEE
ncbi:hypothetical protein QUB05_22290 [Microcoleus sp. F10-C6]|uniref:hypothetical protein n=1 Tax=unclassified Microcoleus TaxID=2642155 RepID=UPI002FD4F8F6